MPLVVGMLLLVGGCGESPFFPSVETDATLGPSGTLDPLAPGVTGTVPYWGDDVSWAPAESPDESAAARIRRSLYGTGLSIILPTSGPPTGTEVSANLSSFATGWGGGGVFRETTVFTLELSSPQGWEMSVDTHGTTIGSCSEDLPGAEHRPVRGDSGACVEVGDAGITVGWVEEGQVFDAQIALGQMSVDELLDWLEEWIWLEDWIPTEPPSTESTTTTTERVRVEWDQTEPLGEAERARLIEALDELGRSLVVPTSPPPFEIEGGWHGPVVAIPNPGYLDQVTISGLIFVRWSDDICLPEDPRVTVRGDSNACLLHEHERSASAFWSEAGEGFSIMVSESDSSLETISPVAPFDAVLEWLETWELLPPS